MSPLLTTVPWRLQVIINHKVYLGRNSLLNSDNSEGKKNRHARIMRRRFLEKENSVKIFVTFS